MAGKDKLNNKNNYKAKLSDIENLWCAKNPGGSRKINFFT